MQKEGITNLKLAGETGFINDLSISVRKDWPELQSILEKALATITPAERKAIYERWVKLRVPPANEPLKRTALWVGAGLLGILAAVLIWNRSLALKVRARTAALRAELARRIETDQALQASEEKFSKAFRSSPDAIFLTRLSDGRVIDANDSAARIYGCAKEELIGHCSFGHGWGYVCAEERDRLVALLEEQGGSLREHELQMLRKNGERFTALVSCETIDVAGEKCSVGVLRDITDQRNAQEARKLAEAERGHLLEQLLESEDEERRRIARELHDTTAQHLAATKMNLTRLRAATGDWPAAQGQALNESLALIEKSVEEIRTLTYLLHPPLLDELGLAGAARDYAAGFAQRSGLRVSVDVEGFSGRLPATMELALFRVVQESLANVHRHSGSDCARIRLERDAEEVRLEIQDNGRGVPAGARAGVGLAGMRERLRQLGGGLEIESDAEGTTVLASLTLGEPGKEIGA
jgi:PAS domain S-box-containing protein